MIGFHCDCGWELSVSAELAGKSARCPGCHKVVSVPARRAEAVRVGIVSPGPWRAVSAVLTGIALVAVMMLVFRRAPDPALLGPSEAHVAEVAGLKSDLAARNREIVVLKEQIAGLVDPVVVAEERRVLQEERDRAVAELEQAQREADAMKVRIETAGAPKADPPPVADTPKPRIADSNSISDVVEKCSPCVLVVKTDNGFGAGFFITSEGLAITNYHVISRARTVTVTMIEGKGRGRQQQGYNAQVVAIDIQNDLALLKVSAGRSVPVAELESRPLRVGEEVIAIGNPGLGSMILDYSISNGIVSNLDREIEGTKYFQTTASINPGNSGGPLFNREGRVVGVVTAKGLDVDNIGFAIPMASVKSLYDRRETVYAVEGSLADWEARNGFKFTHDVSRGIPYESTLIKIVVDGENDRILGLDYSNNGLAVFSISKRKVLRNIFTGSDPTDFQPTANPDVVWVSHIATKSLVKVDVERGKLLDKIEIPHRHESFVLAGDFIWTYGGANLVISLRDKKPFISNLPWLAVSHDRRRDRMLALMRGGRNGYALGEFDPDKMARVLREIAQLRSAPRSAEMHKEFQALTEEQERLVKLHPIPDPESIRGWVAHTLVTNGSSRVYVNRMSLRSDKLETVVGILKANPYSRMNEPGINQLLQSFPRLDRILAGSPDSRWIATGTHLYSGERFTVHKELPVPALAMAFTADSRYLYIYDGVGKVLLPVEVVSKDKK